MKNLGACEVFDYNNPGWETQIKCVSLVLDTVGGDSLSKTWNTVKDDGIIITIGDPPPPWALGQGQAIESAGRPNICYKYFIVSPNAERLWKAPKMIDAGYLRILEVKPFSFHEVEERGS